MTALKRMRLAEKTIVITSEKEKEETRAEGGLKVYGPFKNIVFSFFTKDKIGFTYQKKENDKRI